MVGVHFEGSIITDDAICWAVQCECRHAIKAAWKKCKKSEEHGANRSEGNTAIYQTQFNSKHPFIAVKKMHRRLWRSDVLWAEHFQHTAIIHRGVLVGCSVCSSMEFVFPNLTIYPASIAFFRVRIDISRTKQFTRNSFRCPCSWSWPADSSMSVTGPLNSGGADMSLCLGYQECVHFVSKIPLVFVVFLDRVQRGVWEL